MCTLCSVFHSLEMLTLVSDKLLSCPTSCSVRNYIVTVCFVTGCPMYLAIQSFAPQLDPITLMYDLESA